MTSEGAGASPLKELGRLLEEGRRKRGWSLEEAAQRTKIPAHHIAGIESGDLSKMPAHVYARGFIRSYAAALEMPEGPLMQKLDESGILSATASRRPPQAPPSSAVGPARVPLRVWLAAGGIVILGAGIGFGIRGLFLLIKSSGEERIPPSPFSVPAEGDAAPRDGRKTGPVPASKVYPAAKPGRILPVRASVTASEECWMQVQVDEADPIEVTLAKGESRHWSAKEKLRMLVGNSGGIKLASAAGPIQLPRARGRVVHLLLTPGGEKRLEIPEISAASASVLQEAPEEGLEPAVVPEAGQSAAAEDAPEQPEAGAGEPAPPEKAETASVAEEPAAPEQPAAGAGESAPQAEETAGGQSAAAESGEEGSVSAPEPAAEDAIPSAETAEE